VTSRLVGGMDWRHPASCKFTKHLQNNFKIKQNLKNKIIRFCRHLSSSITLLLRHGKRRCV